MNFFLNGAFFSDELGPIPTGAIQLTDAQHAALMAGNATGQAISSDAKGNPILTAPAGQTLAQAQAAQLAVLQAACEAAITAGYTSAALGTAHTYPSQLTDQQNLMANIAASQGTAAGWTVGIWCAASGAWSLLPHTAAQLAQVNADWVAARSALQQHYAGLVSKVQAATTVAGVQAITWS